MKCMDASKTSCEVTNDMVMSQNRRMDNSVSGTLNANKCILKW